jgi:polyhydroxyalkanoate synthase
MMRLHQTWLPVADQLDRLVSLGARVRLHAQAAAARVAAGERPIDWIGGPATAHRVYSESRLARLLHYPARGPVRGVPILIVSSLINRYYVLDLLPEISVIDLLCSRGFDVWVLDWKAPGAEGPSMSFADYVDGAIHDGARQAAEVAGVPSVAVIGYCMGGTLATLFAARHPALVRALVLLGTPIEFGSSGQLARWTKRELFNADLMMDAYGNMPPSLMQSGFKLMNPADMLFKLARLSLDARNEARVRHVVALEAWLEDNMAFPGGVYREYIRKLYQDDQLMRGEFKVAGTPVSLSSLIAPLLNVIALRDHICAPPASLALMKVVGSPDKTAVEFDTGHIGMTTSKRALKHLWPQIAAWLEERAA